MTMRLLGIACACLWLLAGCNIIYKQNIQQGNALEQEDLDQLEVGMSKNQVAFLLGTPAIQDPFHHDRWDYVSTFSRRGGEPVRRLVTLEFDNGVLSEMSGVRQGESEQVLSADGPLYVQPATPVPGVAVEDARDYEDLSLVPDEFDYWTLQFGSFSYRSEANERLEALESAGVDATIYGQVIGDVGFFVVRSGRYTSREEALRALDRLEERTGLRGFIVTPGS
jgi:outer membrane protein assembly factor BamE